MNLLYYKFEWNKCSVEQVQQMLFSQLLESFVTFPRQLS